MRTVDQFTTLIKVGGSITERGSKDQIKELGQIITEQYEKWGNFIIIPGGGIFAEVIRDIQKQYSIIDEVAHWMAIHAIDQHGLLLSNYIPKSEIIDLNKLRMLDKNSRQMKIPILEVYEFAKDYSKLEHSWNTTSDALACEIALFLGVKKIIFVKDIDGLILNKERISKVTTEELLALKTSPLDPLTPKLLQGKNIKSYIVNGFYPERITAILANKPTIATEVKN